MYRCSIVIVAIWCLSKANSLQNETEVESKSSADTLWIKSLFLEAERNFYMKPNVSQRCKSDFERYEMHLRNQTVWAVRMAEASEWPTVGLFAGITEHLGNYEECLMVASRDLKGQYCLVNAQYEFPANPASAYGTSVVYMPNEEASVWDTLQMYQKNPIRRDRQQLSWAMCIPSSCSFADLKSSLNHLLRPLFQKHKLDITVDLHSAQCSVKESPKISFGFYMLSFFLGTVIALAISSTIYNLIVNNSDRKDIDKPTLLVLFEEFSLSRNFNKLVNMSHAEELPCGHLLKIIYMLAIIFGHRWLLLNQIPIFNVESGENRIFPSSIRLVNLTVVDAFFFLTGLITFYYGLVPMKKHGSLFVVRSLITRWMRLVPMLCIIQLFVIYILPYLNDGPQWNQRFLAETGNCRASFWANLFCLSNFISANKQCLIISWYVAVDIQLAIIGCIFLLIISKNETLGICLSAVAFVVASVATFIVVYSNRYNGLILGFYNFQRTLFSQEEFNYFYNSFYPRIPPYLTGFLIAYLTKSLIKRNYKFSNMKKILMIIAGFGLKVLVMVYGLQFYKIGRQYSPIENGLYAAISRWLYILFEASIAITGFTSSLGKLDGILNCKMFIPFGRLTYSVFLTNTLIQLFHIASQRTVIESSSLVNEIWWTTGDVVYSYLLGLLLHLFLEAPISGLSKRLLQNLFSSKTAAKKDSKMAAFSVVGKLPVKGISVEGEKAEAQQFSKDNKSFEKNETV